MRWVPELVFINCCHLGKTLGNTAAQGRFSLLAANLAVQFIGMGVKAVVAAGWAVDDGAAEAFAESFYTHMLEGASFGEAVRAAREEIWVRFPDANTWGAYQCYGDPGYLLRRDGGEPGLREVNTYHAPAELVSDLHNYSEWIRMRASEKGADPAELDVLRTGIVDKLKAIPDKIRGDWLARGDVAAALGFAWGETRAYAEAVDWLEKALAAEKGDCPVRAVEQCTNFRVRLSGERWQEMRETAEKVGAEAGRQDLIRDIEQAIRELDLISQRAPTPERLSLLGSACKRLAWVHTDAAPRLEALINMASYYWQAYEKAGGADPYPFTNWAVAKLLAVRLDDEQRGEWEATLPDECQRMIEVALGRDADKPNFWNSVAEADCELVKLLLQGRTRGKEAEHIAALYRTAFRRGASPREIASVHEHLDFVIALGGSLAKSVREALGAIRSAL
jgi:tetratricopeptide (TPR) repeat protein